MKHRALIPIESRLEGAGVSVRNEFESEREGKTERETVPIFPIIDFGV
jgi:hypothetical protein